MWNFLKDMGWILRMLEEEFIEGVIKEDPNDVNEVEVELLERYGVDLGNVGGRI